MVSRALALALVVLLLAACGSSTQSPTVPHDRTSLQWGIVGVTDVPTLDPALASDPTSISVASLVYGGLVRFDEHLRVQPDGASHWTISRNGLVYTFTIRPHLRFADGRTVTAADFAGALQRALGPEGSAGTGPVYLDLIQHGAPGAALPGVQVLGPSTLRITLSRPASHFLAELAFPASFVPERSLFARYGQSWTDHAAGFGPYVVRSWRHSRVLTLQPNRFYYGGRPTFRRIAIHFYALPGALGAYRRGALDVVSGLPAGQSIGARPPGLQAVAGLDQDYLAFNTRRLPFFRTKARFAFASVWSPTMARGPMAGTALPANGFLPSAFGLRTARWTPRESGKAYLAGARYVHTVRFPSVTLIMPHDAHVFALAQVLQAAWQRKLGIAVGLRQLNPSLYSSVLTSHQFDLAIVRWGGDYPDPQDYLGTQLGSSPFNVTGWSRATYNDDVFLADSYGPSDPRRATLFAQAAALAAARVPLLPLDEPALVALVRPGLRGVAVTPLGTVVGRWPTARFTQ